MNEDQIVSELEKMRYPTEEDGWIKRPQNGLPSYRVLRKSLHACGIKPSLVWDKEECLNAIRKNPQQPERIFEDKTTDALYANLLNSMRQEKRHIQEIRSITPKLKQQIANVIQEKENEIIKQQLAMMK